MIYFLCILLFVIGLYGVVVKRNLIKIIIGLTIMEYAVFLLLAVVGYKEGATAPIISKEFFKGPFVDPLPQALVLTAIVIGLAVTALAVSIAVRIYEKYETLDIREIKRLRG